MDHKMNETTRLGTPEWRQRLGGIRLLCMDVDGVLSDGRLYFQSDGIEIKAFHTQDGLGLKLLKRIGIEVAIITGRSSPMVTERAKALGIAHLVQGCEDKLSALNDICQPLDIGLEQTAYCGDDLPDLPAIRAAGIGIAVPNAVAEVRRHADWITQRQGGHGAVREICDALIDGGGHRQRIMAPYLLAGP